jgi:hypothetical protein
MGESFPGGKGESLALTFRSRFSFANCLLIPTSENAHRRGIGGRLHYGREAGRSEEGAEIARSRSWTASSFARSFPSVRQSITSPSKLTERRHVERFRR